MIDRIKTLVECVLVKLGLKEPKKNLRKKKIRRRQSTK
jgi:hypothetical protein